MSLQSLFTELLEKYPQAQKEEFAGHPLGILVRGELKIRWSPSVGQRIG